MSIRIIISQHVRFNVSGTFADADGKAQEFSFGLTTKRLNQEELDAAQAALVIGAARDGNHKACAEQLVAICTDWHDVKDEHGEPIPYSAEGLQALLRCYQNLALHVWRTYVAEAGVKAKN